MTKTNRARLPEKVQKALPYVEMGIALLPAMAIVSSASLRALVATCAFAVLDGAFSSLRLIPTDPASALTAFAALSRVILLLAPLARMFARAPRHRLAWIPLVLVVWLGVLGTSVAAFSSVLMWALLCIASAAAWFLVARPWFALAAFLPWIFALEPMLGHSPLGDSVWTKARLAERCRENDGMRPVDLSPDFMVARYFGVTPFDKASMLVTGERRSFWAHYDANNKLFLGSPLTVRGNMWQGCVRDGSAWLTRRDFLCEVPTPREGQGPGKETCYEVRGPAELGPELDYVDVVCPSYRPTVYVSQLVRGGYLEFDSKTGGTTFHSILPGMNLQLVERPDGMLAGITTSRLFLFDPKTDRVVEEHPAGAVAMGIDVCRSDNALVVTDFVGRVRIYEWGSDGHYHFVRGAFYPAPRRAAFSPDCSSIAITSGNDRNAFLLRRSDLGLLRSYRLGPGLRDIVFLDAERAAVVDACTVNVLDTKL